MGFVWRRKVEGEPTDDDWLKNAFFTVLSQDQPDGWTDMKYSNGWVDNFKKRFNISYLCQTNKKNRPLQDKVHLIQNFHRWLLLDLQMGPPRCPKYGRFPARMIFHLDQIPLPFVLSEKRTLSGVGEPVFIRAPKSSFDPAVHSCSSTTNCENRNYFAWSTL